MTHDDTTKAIDFNAVTVAAPTEKPAPATGLKIAAALHAINASKPGDSFQDKMRAVESALAGLALVALSACGVPGLDPMVADTPAEAHCETHRCNYDPISFDVEQPEYLADTERALTQLADISQERIGLDSEFGIPVRFVPHTFYKGTETCGNTIITFMTKTRDILSIEVEIGLEPPAGCPETWKTVRHEVACHAIPGLGDNHTESGVCAASGGGGEFMDARSLGQMCEGLDGCPSMLR